MRLYGRPTIFWNGSGTDANSGSNGGNAGSASNGGANGGGNAPASNGGSAPGTTAPAGGNAAGSGADAGTETMETLRSQLAAAQGRVSQFEADAEKQRQATLTAEQKATERADKAEKRAIASDVRLAAQEAGAASAAIVARLINVTDIKFDADGNPTNITDLVNQIMTENPFLKKPDAAATGPQPPTVPAVRPTNGGAQNGGTPQTFTRSQIADPAFYAANSTAIHKAAQEGRIVNG